MNPPFSNERLRNIKTEYTVAEDRKFVEAWSNRISNAILEVAAKKSTAILPMEWVGPHTYKLKLQQHDQGRPFAKFIDPILFGVMERFPEMQVMQDPFRTYVIFDWS